MKKMKLFYGISILLMILSSCSSNDNSDEESISIVGIWKHLKIVDVCSTGNEVASSFSVCIQMTKVTFNSNGTLNGQQYSENIGNCIETFVEGTWNLTGENLTTTISGETSNHTFFELTSNSLKIGEYDNSYGPCDGGNLSSHYYTEFIKVE